MAELKLNEDKRQRVESLARDLDGSADVRAAVMRELGARLLGARWNNCETQREREEMFVGELEATLDALDYIVRMVYPADGLHLQKRRAQK